MTSKGLGLVVDDERVTLAVVTSLLERLGYEVRAVPSGTEAMRQFALQRPKIVVSDYHMHPITGLDLWKILNRPTAGYVPFVLMTTRAMREQLERDAKVLPVTITKPFNSDILLRAVEFACGGTRDNVVQPISSANASEH